MSNLPLTIAVFSATLLVTLSLLIYLLVWKFPRSLVFWKRSDYVYFATAILAATLAFVNQSSDTLQNQIVQLKVERNNLASRIANNLMSFQEGCRRRVELEWEYRGGVVRSPRPREFLLPAPPTEKECLYVEEAIIASLGFTDDEMLNWTGPCVPHEFPHLSNEYSLYEYQLAGPSGLVATICEEIAQKDQRLSYVRWLDPFQGFWPAFLGFAFGIRLARVHAEVKDALAKEGHVSKPSHVAIIAKRIALAYSQMRQRLRDSFRTLP